MAWSKKTLLAEVERLLDREICALGFQKRASHRYTYEVNPETMGVLTWLELDQLFGDRNLGLVVNLAVRNVQLAKKRAELKGRRRSLNDTNIGSSLEELAGPDAIFRWVFQDGANNDAVAQQVGMDILRYGLPYLQAHATLEAVTRTAAAKPGKVYPDVLPVAYYLLGQTDKAKEALERSLAGLEERTARGESYLDPDFRVGAVNLLRLLGDPERAERVAQAARTVSEPPAHDSPPATAAEEEPV